MANHCIGQEGLVLLEDAQAVFPRDVAVGKHGYHAGQRAGSGHVDAADAGVGIGGPLNPDPQAVFRIMIGRVFFGAGYLGDGIGARRGAADLLDAPGRMAVSRPGVFRHTRPRPPLF